MVVRFSPSEPANSRVAGSRSPRVSRPERICWAIWSDSCRESGASAAGSSFGLNPTQPYHTTLDCLWKGWDCRQTGQEASSAWFSSSASPGGHPCFPFRGTERSVAVKSAFATILILASAPAARAPSRGNAAHETGPRPSASDGKANPEEHSQSVGIGGLGRLPHPCRETGRTEKAQAREGRNYRSEERR